MHEQRFKCQTIPFGVVDILMLRKDNNRYMENIVIRVYGISRYSIVIQNNSATKKQLYQYP